MKLNKTNYDTAVQLLYRMKRMRIVEETIADRYPEGKMRCPVHLSIGQEGVAAAAGLALNSDDQVISTHRSHAHYLGKGGNLNAMIAELYGKATGCSGGRGGSMHLQDLSVGFIASTAIVANSIPIGAGIALANRILNIQRVCCVFFGDAAIEEGVFYETINFAVLKKLPVLFLCENNLYSVYTSLSERQPANRHIWSLAAGLGCKSEHADGNDCLMAYNAIRDALNSIRCGQGPVFIEFATYRWREHCGPNYDNNLGYRTTSEFDAWKQSDPIIRLTQEMQQMSLIDSEKIKRMEADIATEVEKAFSFAETSPFPPSSEAFALLYEP